MAKRARSQETSAEPTAESTTSTLTEGEVITETPEIIEASASDPAEVKLLVPETTELAPARSTEEIITSVKEKLARKTDLPVSNPFVPAIQLEYEVRNVANTQGFPLSRGTEIGARLMARSKRKPL